MPIGPEAVIPDYPEMTRAPNLGSGQKRRGRMSSKVAI